MLKPYLFIVAAYYPICAVVLMRHWWKEFNEPKPVSFGGILWAFCGAIPAAVLWPATTVICFIWLLVRIPAWIRKHV